LSSPSAAAAKTDSPIHTETYLARGEATDQNLQKNEPMIFGNDREISTSELNDHEEAKGSGFSAKAVSPLLN
jgi:hypothetical protein